MLPNQEEHDLDKIRIQVAWLVTQLPEIGKIHEIITQAWRAYYVKEMEFLVHHHGPVSEKKIVETLIETGTYKEEFSFFHYDHSWLSIDVENACLKLLKILPETEFFELELSWDSDRHGNGTDVKYSIKLLVHPNNLALSTDQ